METKEITRAELGGKKPVCFGYKAVAWDNGTKQSEYRYAPLNESLVGRIFSVDGDIATCKWGLHFSKDPAYVFNFYEPLGYNKYFKVAAYDEVVDADDDYKSVTSTLEFVEEYDLMEYIEIIKRFDRSAVSGSSAVRGSNAVSGSRAVSDSNAVSDSYAVSDSRAVSYSNAVRGSYAVSGSSAVRGSYAVSDSYAVMKSEAVKYCIFCHGIEAQKNMLFNKPCTEERFHEVYDKLKSYNWVPNWHNWYDIKGNKEWWALCFPQLARVDNDIAWSKMPKQMKNYIFSLPEFDAYVWEKITGKE